MAGITASTAASTPAGGVDGSIRLPIRKAISGSARGWMSSASAHRLAVWHDHARCQLAVDRLVDAEGEALDPAGESQLRADDVLAGLQAVLDDQRLGFVRGVRVEEGVHAGERSDGCAVPFAR